MFHNIQCIEYIHRSNILLLLLDTDMQLLFFYPRVCLIIIYCTQSSAVDTNTKHSQSLSHWIDPNIHAQLRN